MDIVIIRCRLQTTYPSFILLKAEEVGVFEVILSNNSHRKLSPSTLTIFATANSAGKYLVSCTILQVRNNVVKWICHYSIRNGIQIVLNIIQFLIYWIRYHSQFPKATTLRSRSNTYFSSGECCVTSLQGWSIAGRRQTNAEVINIEVSIDTRRFRSRSNTLLFIVGFQRNTSSGRNSCLILQSELIVLLSRTFYLHLAKLNESRINLLQLGIGNVTDNHLLTIIRSGRILTSVEANHIVIQVTLHLRCDSNCTIVRRTVQRTIRVEIEWIASTISIRCSSINIRITLRYCCCVVIQILTCPAVRTVTSTCLRVAIEVREVRSLETFVARTVGENTCILERNLTAVYCRADILNISIVVLIRLEVNNTNRIVFSYNRIY